MIFPNISCFIIGNNCVKYAYDSYWLLLYYHNFDISGPWVRGTAERNFETNKYSILYSINPSLKINGEYEFLLEYPEKNGYQRWYQSSNPMEEFENPSLGKRNAEGYREHTVSWTTCGWGGLVRTSNQDIVLLDGTTYHDDSYYSIGRYSSYNGAVPGNDNDILIKISILWIRVVSFDKCTIKYKMTNTNNLMFAYVTLLS